MEKTLNIGDILHSLREEAFLQSEEWRFFQESEGKKTYHREDISDTKKSFFWANVIEHRLPIVGKYFYVPRGPITLFGSKEFPISNDQIKCGMQALIDLAEKENAGWIRIDPRRETDLEMIKENVEQKIVRAPHNMQSKEIFVVDISKTKEELLLEMKSKTRYNVRLAEKKGIVISYPLSVSDSDKYLEEFLRLNRETAKRDGITTHSDDHYRKMVEVLGEDILRLYVAEYKGAIIAANLVVFYGDTAIYLHGASSNHNRDVMAPYLLQWRQILDAKEKGCRYYDFGGIKTQDTRYKIQDTKSWEGITRFKIGFSPKTEPIVFLGSYDIIINPGKYFIYKVLQGTKALLYKIKK